MTVFFHGPVSFLIYNWLIDGDRACMTEAVLASCISKTAGNGNPQTHDRNVCDAVMDRIVMPSHRFWCFRLFPSHDLLVLPYRDCWMLLSIWYSVESFLVNIGTSFSCRLAFHCWRKHMPIFHLEAFRYRLIVQFLRGGFSWSMAVGKLARSKARHSSLFNQNTRFIAFRSFLGLENCW